MEREQLENLSIFELRDFARKIGVFNPTVLKKNDLIDAIQDVQSGKVKPHVSKNKQGRPPKEIGRLASIFVPSEVMDIPTMQEKFYEPKENPVKFYCNMEKPEDADAILYKGYFELLANGDGLLRKKIDSTEKAIDRCFLRSKTIREFNIKPGDEIICNAYFISDDRPLFGDSIISINCKNIEEMKEDRPDFDELSHSHITRKVNFKESFFTFNYGDTVFGYNQNVNDFVRFAVQFSTKNKESFDKFIYLSPVSKGDKYDLLRNFPDELYVSTFQDTFSNQQRSAFMAINRAKRLAESGQNVCLIIQDVLEISALDNNNPNGELQISKEILSSAKNMSVGSLTIICGFKEITLPYMRHKINTTFAPLETCGIQIDGKDF